MLRDVPIPANKGLNSDPKPIELTDEDTESSEIVHLFLSALEGRDLPPPSEDGFKLIGSALELTDKYECPQARRTLLHDLTRYIPIPKEDWTFTTPIHLFKLAAKYDDVYLAALALSLGGSWKFGGAESDKATPDESTIPTSLECLNGASVFDFSAWSLKGAKKMNMKYSMALLRATRDPPLSGLSPADRKKYDWSAAAKRFRDNLSSIPK